MNKTVVIHQPDFLPYLGFFHRFLYANLWIIFDNVQFLNNSKSWHNRDKIKTQKGERWLTVSVKKCPQKTPINEVYLSDTNWQVQNINLIKESYNKAPFYNEIMPFIQKLYNLKTEKMIDFNLASIDTLCELFGIKIDKIMASELNPNGKSNELLVDILNKTGANTYLSGVGSKNYYDPEPFKKNNINIIWQEFKHPVYPQLYGEFIPYLSSVDLLFNCGVEGSRKILRSI